MFSLPGSFLTFLALPFSVHVVACVQSNWQSGLGPRGWLPGRLATTIQEAGTYLEGTREEDTADESRASAGFLIKNTFEN